MKRGLSARELRTVIVGGFLGIGVLSVYFSMILKPLWREAASLGERVSSARAQLEGLRQSITNEAALSQQHRSLQEAVISLRTQLPSETELPAMIEFLSGLASQTQVKIQTIFPQRATNLPDERLLAGQGNMPRELMVYKEIPIQIDAQANFHQLGTFLSLVEASQKPMQVSTLRISGNPKEPRWHNVSLSLLTYFAVSEDAAGDAAAPRF